MVAQDILVVLVLVRTQVSQPKFSTGNIISGGKLFYTHPFRQYAPESRNIITYRLQYRHFRRPYKQLTYKQIKSCRENHNFFRTVFSRLAHENKISWARNSEILRSISGFKKIAYKQYRSHQPAAGRTSLRQASGYPILFATKLHTDLLYA